MIHYLIRAIINNNLDEVKYYVETGADINEPNEFGESPLFAASFKGNLSIVKYLVEHGADINATDSTGTTAVSIADSQKHYDVVKYLVQQGSDYNEISKDIVEEMIKEESNKLKSELAQNYMTLEKGTPQVVIEGKMKSYIPKNLLLRQVYEKPYRELCSVINKDYPPLKLIALANMLRVEYDYHLDVSWINLCDKVKQSLYLFL